MVWDPKTNYLQAWLVGRMLQSSTWINWDRKQAKSNIQQLSEGLADRLDAIIFDLDDSDPKTNYLQAWLVGRMPQPSTWINWDQKHAKSKIIASRLPARPSDNCSPVSHVSNPKSPQLKNMASSLTARGCQNFSNLRFGVFLVTNHPN